MLQHLTTVCEAKNKFTLTPWPESVSNMRPTERVRVHVKQSKSAPYMGVELYIAGFDIRSIETHPETSTELKKASLSDGIAC